MDGVALARALTHLHPHTRVLYSSGHTHAALRERGIDVGRVDLLRKPYAPAALIERVRRALDAGRGSQIRTGT